MVSFELLDVATQMPVIPRTKIPIHELTNRKPAVGYFAFRGVIDKNRVWVISTYLRDGASSFSADQALSCFEFTGDPDFPLRHLFCVPVGGDIDHCFSLNCRGNWLRFGAWTRHNMIHVAYSLDNPSVRLTWSTPQHESEASSFGPLMAVPCAPYEPDARETYEDNGEQEEVARPLVRGITQLWEAQTPGGGEVVLLGTIEHAEWAEYAPRVHLIDSGRLITVQEGVVTLLDFVDVDDDDNNDNNDKNKGGCNN